jgi:hypothetical protein
VISCRWAGRQPPRVAQADADEPGKHHQRWMQVCLPLYGRRPGAEEYFRQLRARSIETPR